MMEAKRTFEESKGEEKEIERERERFFTSVVVKEFVERESGERERECGEEGKKRKINEKEKKRERRRLL